MMKLKKQGNCENKDKRVVQSKSLCRNIIYQIYKKSVHIF